jgi:phage shock protein A
MTQTQCEKTTQRLEAQHEELLRKIDELDKHVAEVLAEWTQIKDFNAGVFH